MGHLRFVINFCRNNQHENKEKVIFYSITFLNFLNIDQGLSVDPKRIKVISEWPTPPCIREIWDFNDLTNFYKRFVSYFSILVAPFIELVRNYVLSWEDGQERNFQFLPYSNIPKITNTYIFIFFLQVLRKEFLSFKNLWIWGQIIFKGEGIMQSYPPRALDRRLQEDWTRDPREGPKVLMNLRINFRFMD